MKEPKYIEGPEAIRNFEEGMKFPLHSFQRRSCKGREEEAEGFFVLRAYVNQSFPTGTRRALFRRLPPPLSFRDAAIRPYLLVRSRLNGVRKLGSWRERSE